MRLRIPFDPVGPFRSTISFLGLLPLTLGRLVRLLVDCKIDVVNIHYPGDAGIYFGLCCLLLRRKLVVSVHGADFFPDGQAKRVSLLTRVLLTLSHAIVTPSHAFLRDVVRCAPSVRDKGNAIHNGIDIGEFCLGDSEQKGVSRGQEYILCIAHQSKKKGVDVLVKAFAEVKKRFPSCKLVLVGEGPERPLLEDLIRQFDLHNTVEFVGWKSRPEIMRLLSGCRAFVLPSRSEPFGIVFVEAMACKKVVVGTDVGGIPEIICHGQNGLLVPPDSPAELANAIMSVLLDSEAVRTMAERGYVTVCSRFTRDHMGQNYARLFCRLLNKQRQDRLSDPIMDSESVMPEKLYKRSAQ
jgi:glycosyltransferase involved in cell wall biosynthesis